MNTKKASKFLSYVLRHNPGALGLDLDPAGWVEVELLLHRWREHRGGPLSREDLEVLVRQDAKGRYTLEAGRIRANQGHSVAGVLAVDLSPLEPPEVLYHGTTEERWARIRATGGLAPMGRHHVHMSPDLPAARQVASRHRRERPLILRVEARRMWSAGFEFYCSENGVWMADRVPLDYLAPLDG